MTLSLRSPRGAAFFLRAFVFAAACLVALTASAAGPVLKVLSSATTATTSPPTACAFSDRC